MEIVCVPIIVAGVYALIELYKAVIAKDNAKLCQIIPVIGLVLGGILGVVLFYACPNLILANNLLNAIVIGAASGLSATGCNQIFKQLKKFGVNVQEVEPSAEPSTKDAEKSTEQPATEQQTEDKNLLSEAKLAHASEQLTIDELINENEKDK